MTIDRFIAEKVMGLKWNCLFRNPDYSTTDKAALMDKCVGEEWFPKLLDYTFNKAFDESEEDVESFLQSDSSRDTFYTYQVYAYLWRNLRGLVAEYKGWEGEK